MFNASAFQLLLMAQCPTTGSADDSKWQSSNAVARDLCGVCLRDVALFLPFRCTKERQMAASSGTERSPKIAAFFE